MGCVMLVQGEATRISIFKQMGKVSNEQTPGTVGVYSISIGAMWLRTPKVVVLSVLQRHLPYFWVGFLQIVTPGVRNAYKNSSFLALLCDFRKNQNWTVTSASAAKWLHAGSVIEEKRLWERSSFQATLHSAYWTESFLDSSQDVF